MASKVFDAYGDIHVNTKDAEKDFDALDKAIDKMNKRISIFGDSMMHADRMSASFSRRFRQGFLTGMEASLQRNEGGLIALGNALEVAGSGFKKTENESALALKSFQQFQRRAYSLQSALGVVAGTIGDLSGGFLSLIGILGQAAFAFVGVGTALMNVVAGFAVARIAMSGVGRAVSQLWNGQNQYNRSLRDARKELKDLKFDLEGAVLSEKEAAIELEKARTQLAMAQDLPPDNMVRREAELAFQRADLNYRRAKARVNDLQDTIKRGGNAAARAANADPFRNLTKSQIAFAKYLVTLKPIIQALKEAAASSFLPPLQNAIQTLVRTLLPTLMMGFRQLGSAMGYAANQFANTFNKPENVKALQDFFTDSAPRIRQLGDAASKFLSGFLKLMQSSKPLTDRFIIWIDSVASRLNALADSSSTRRFLDLAGYVASQLGHVFASFGDGIKNIMDANFPPGGGGAGQVLLDWLSSIAQGFEKFTSTSEFPKWLKDTTTNATVALGVIGDFLHIFIELSGRPEIKQFWETLGKAVPSLTKILMDGIKAAPAFGELIVSLLKLVTILSDSGALESFFTTLRIISDVLIKILEPLKPFLDFLGKIHGVFLAIGLAIIVFNTTGMIFMAILGKIAKFVGVLFGGFTKLVGGVTRFNTVLATSEKPMATWGRSLTNWLRGLGNANRAMNRNAADTISLRYVEDQYTQILKAKPTLIQNVTGRFKIYNAALKEAFSNTRANTGAIRSETSATRAANGVDKQKVSGLKLIKMSFKDLVNSVKEYNQVMKMKTDVDIANSKAARTGLAIEKEILETRRRNTLMNRQAGAGTTAGRFAGRGAGGMGLIGAGFAAEGLIAGAANGGMTLGTGLTAIGGAAMFLPGAGMIAGLGLSIVGSIVQGFEAAERAAKEKRMEITANEIAITAQNVSTTTAKVNDELSNLMATGKYTYDQALALIKTRAEAAKQIAVQAGADSGELEQVRLAFQDAGIKAGSAQMKALLGAAATYLAKSPEATAENVSSAILSVLKSKGQNEVTRVFGQLSTSTAPPGTTRPPFLTPQVSPTQLQVQETTPGVFTDRLVSAVSTTDAQVKALKKIIMDPKSYTIENEVVKMGLIYEDLALNANLLAGFTPEALNIAAQFAESKNLKESTVNILKNARTGTPTKLVEYPTRSLSYAKDIIVPAPQAALGGLANQTAAGIGSLYGAPRFDFSTGKIVRNTAGSFTTTDIEKIKGTKRDPSVSQLIPTPGEVNGISNIADYSQKTANALSILSGLVDDNGQGLKIVDVSAKDKVAPQIVYLGKNEALRAEYEILNTALRIAWGQ